jgi:hypothetical protein
MLIGLTGLAGSGKSTVGNILQELCGFTQLYFAEPVYQAVWELNPMVCTDYRTETYQRLQELVEAIGWDKAKRTYPEVRRFLKILGTEIGRTMIGIDIWINILEEKRQSLPIDTNVVITDVRFPNEDWYVHNSGGSLWRVTRPGIKLDDSHSSELGQKDLQEDYTLRNNGDLTSLYEKVQTALDWERSRTR